MAGMSGAENEKAVLGCILIDARQVMPLLAAELTPDDFLLAEHRSVFAACMSAFAEGRSIDAVTILDKLGGSEGWKALLVDLVESTPTAAHARDYARLVKSNARRTLAISQARELRDMLQSGAALEDCQALAGEISQSMNTAHGVCLSASEGFALVEKALDNPRQYIPTGFSRLDRFVRFDFGDYLVIGGRPSSGKTAFSLQVALTMAREHTIAYFSLETAVHKVYERLLSCYSGISFEEFNTGKILDRGAFAAQRAEFSKLRLHVVEAAGWTVAQLCAKALQLRADVMMVDYIGLIHGSGKSLYERVTGISLDLHTLAQRHKIGVVALAQLNRAGDGEPDLTSLRESGQIEQDANAVLLLYTPGEKGDKQTNERVLTVAKNKTGRVGKLRLSFQGETQRFFEIVGDGREPPF